MERRMRLIVAVLLLSTLTTVVFAQRLSPRLRADA